VGTAQKADGTEVLFLLSSGATRMAQIVVGGVPVPSSYVPLDINDNRWICGARFIWDNALQRYKAYGFLLIPSPQ